MSGLSYVYTVEPLIKDTLNIDHNRKNLSLKTLILKSQMFAFL